MVAPTSHLLAAEGLRAWPEGTWSRGYRLRHTLSRQVLYDQLGAGRRLWLHPWGDAQVNSHLHGGCSHAAGATGAQWRLQFLSPLRLTISVSVVKAASAMLY